MFRTKLVAVDDSLGVVFPREILEKWQIGVGDTVYAEATGDGIQVMLRRPENAGLPAPSPSTAGISGVEYVKK